MNYQNYVASLIARSRKAQEIAAHYNQEKVEQLIAAIAYGVTQEDFRRKISEMLVEECGMGSVEDKIGKMLGKVKQVYYQNKDELSCDLVEVNEKTGMSKYYKPMGVIAALIPVTNSEVTQFSKAIMCLKGRNSIIFAPHPKGAKTTVVITERLREILKMYDAPEDLIMTVDPEYVSVDCSGELMKQADFVLATGGTPMVRAAYSSGTPTIGVGTGNSTTFVDGTTNLDDVANMIMRSKTFDYATSCSTENNIIVLESIHDDFVEALKRQGFYFIPEDSEEKEKLKKGLWPEWPANHKLNRHIVAQSADKIAEIAGLNAPKGTTVIATEENGGTGEAFPFSGEKLSPITCLFTVKDFDGALDKMENILNYQGSGHSCGIHSTDDEKIAKMAERMKVTKMCVNQPQSLSNSGAWWNGFNKSTTLGCATWGHNSISHNVTWKDLVNCTYVSRPIKNYYEPTMEELFPEAVREVIDKKF
jgi:NAD-dependent aldehyde dehydrogenases